MLFFFALKLCQYLATTNPLPALPENKNPAFKTVKIAKPIAFSRIVGGMIISKPCPGSKKGIVSDPYTFSFSIYLFLFTKKRIQNISCFFTFT